MNKYDLIVIDYPHVGEVSAKGLLEKFDKAFSFSKSIWRKDQFFFEVDFLLGLHSFINEEYKEAEKNFSQAENKSE